MKASGPVSLHFLYFLIVELHIEAPQPTHRITTDRRRVAFDLEDEPPAPVAAPLPPTTAPAARQNASALPPCRHDIHPPETPPRPMASHHGSTRLDSDSGESFDFEDAVPETPTVNRHRTRLPPTPSRRGNTPRSGRHSTVGSTARRRRLSGPAGNKTGHSARDIWTFFEDSSDHARNDCIFCK